MIDIMRMISRMTRMEMGIALALAILVGSIIGSGHDIAYAADGDLDTSFGGDGRVTTDYIATNDEARAVAIQADGKIVVVGTTYVNPSLGYNFAVARYNPNGTPDNSFSGDGKLTTDYYGGDDAAYAVTIEPAGKIVVAGTVWWPHVNDYATAIARYNVDGALDTTFNSDGKLIFCCGANQAVAMQDDGKIVVAGKNSNNENFQLVRYTTDGSRDDSFGNGWVQTDFAGHEDEARGVAIQDDGKIVATGAANMGNYNYNFALARYNPNGSLDTTFDADGKVTTDFFGGDDGAYAMTIQPNGKILAAGTFYSTGQGYDFGLARYNYDGSLDTGFGSGGLTSIYFVPGTAEEVAYGVAVGPDGRIVAAGYALCSYGGTCFANYDMALARLNSNGSLDTTFSGDGLLITDFAGANDRAYGVAVEPDGRIVAAGYAPMGGTGTDLAVARYLSGEPPTPTPTNTPTQTRTNTPLPTQTAGGLTATPEPSHTATIAPTQTPGGPTATPQATSCPLQFPDVLPGSTFYDFVRCLACRGVINGFPDNTFRPNSPVTRGQLSKIVSNSAGFSDPQSAQMFEDVPLGSTFHDFIGRLASRGYIGGYPCGGAREPCVPPANLPYFRPDNNATRGQISKIVSNAAGYSDPPLGQSFEDVAPASTFYTVIQRLTSRSIMQGYPCGSSGEPCIPPENRPYFRPNNSATRGQTTKLVSNTFFPTCQTPARR